MSLKTDFCFHNDDFVECDGKIQELTVTITLCEYRNLVQTVKCHEMENWRLQEEKAKLEAEKKSLQDALLACKNPDLFRNIGKAMEEEAEPEATELTATLKEDN